MNPLTRISDWFGRFCVSTQILGLKNTAKIFLLGRLRGSRIKIDLPNRRPFYFDGVHDLGVMSHLFTRGYRIDDNADSRVTTIIDAGANVGTETARFLAHHPLAEIAAVEVAARNFELLEKSFGDEPKVRLFSGAVWPRSANLEIVTGGGMQSFSVRETEESQHSIPAFSIRTIIEEMGWDHVDILKLDIEGAEYELLTTNASEWIHDVNVFIIEFHDQMKPGATQALYQALGDAKYDTRVCGENLVVMKAGLNWKLRTVVGFDSETAEG